MPFDQRLQPDLSTPDGKSIVPTFSPKCPNCRKRGGMVVLRTEAVPEGRLRDRHCTLCAYTFQTMTLLPDECPHCGSHEGWSVKRATPIANGYYRKQRCRTCKKYVKSAEFFPTPEDKRKRPTL